jgi:imidazolonepropionase
MLLVHDLDELLTLDPDQGRGALGRMERASVLFQDGQVAWIGPASQAPDVEHVVDGRGCVGVPGLVDAHTHSLWAGSRSDEFERRLGGVSYSEILEQGGGILSTVRATRAAGDAALSRLLGQRLHSMLRRGVTSVEVKTGYALDPLHERRHLELLAHGRWPVRVLPTSLAAHAIPAEHRGDRDAYVDLVVERMLPDAQGLAEFVDVYCDRGAFTLDEAERILRAGQALGLKARVHAEQVQHTGVAALAGRLGACSADHLERVDAAGIDALATGGTTAVLLPGAMLYLRDPAPPVQALLEAGVPIALATDLNPGSSPVHDLWTIATLGCVVLRLSVEQAVLGITRNAGRALGRPELGWLGPGSAADMAVMRPPAGEPARIASLIQHLAGHTAAHVVRDGALAWSE